MIHIGGSGIVADSIRLPLPHDFEEFAYDRYHAVLSTVLTKAVEWGYLPNNPASGVQLPKLVTVRKKWVLTPEQASALLTQLPPMPRGMVALAIMTGVRRGELFALKWKGFDREKGTLYVQEGIYENVIDSPKTEKSTRLIPLSPQAIQLLSAWFEVSSRQAPEDFIFSRQNGKPKDPKQIIRDHIAPACARIGIPRASWLTFRRTFATWADQQGVSPKQRGELMGTALKSINACTHRSWTNRYGLLSSVLAVNCSLIVHSTPDG